LPPDLRLDDPALAHGEELGVAVPLAGLPQLVLVHDEHVVAGGRHPLEFLVGESVARSGNTARRTLPGQGPVEFTLERAIRQ